MKTRKIVVITEDQAFDWIEDGMTVVIGGFITAHHPMSIIRGIARRGISSLTVIGGLSSSFDLDLLIGYGCVREVAAAYIGGESVAPVGPFFKWFAEQGRIKIWECDEMILAAMLSATAFALPFFPTRSGLGTDITELNRDIKQFTDPINGEPMLAVPSRKIDLAITHASSADIYGNVQYEGNCYYDAMMQRAADKTLTTVEKIVPPEFIRKDPFKTAYRADAIVKAPFGAHPFSSHGYYCEDEAFLSSYATAAYIFSKGDSTNWDLFREKFIERPKDHGEYLEAIGIKQLLTLDEFKEG